MTTFPLALVIGFVAGFLGAIPPGPLNINIIRKASHGEMKNAIRVALGGALIDALICALIGLGFGWLLERVMADRFVKAGLALFLVAYGLKILLVDRKKGRVPVAVGPPAGTDQAPERRWFDLPFLVGLLQGAANPALFVNWTLLTGFLVGHGLLSTGTSPALGFALGIGVGVFVWFLVLAQLFGRLTNDPAGEWAQKVVTIAGFLLVAFGLFFTWRSFRTG